MAAVTSAPPARAQAAAPATARDPWFDNAKMALVMLVVVGHSWVMLPSNDVVSELYHFLYTWHVPAFVLVTGFLSRSFAYTPHRLWQLVRTVAVPYVIFETALTLFRIYVGNENLKGVFSDPHWPMWYLSALFFWRLGTPIFKAMPTSVALPVAVAISLAGGAVADSTFDFFRICGFLPFFVLGLKADRAHLERLRSRGVQVAAVASLAAIAVAALFYDQLVGTGGTDWLYYSYGYDDLGVGTGHGALVRAALLVVGLVGALSFLALVPRLGGWFTRMGAATLVVYLFHGFVIKSFEYAGYDGWSNAHQVLSLPLTTAGAVGLALLLAWPRVAAVLNHVVDPFGYAERHVTHAVALADAPDQAVALHEEITGQMDGHVADAVDLAAEDRWEGSAR